MVVLWVFVVVLYLAVLTAGQMAAKTADKSVDSTADMKVEKTEG